jgi:hypothetical protein
MATSAAVICCVGGGVDEHAAKNKQAHAAAVNEHTVEFLNVVAGLTCFKFRVMIAFLLSLFF